METILSVPFPKKKHISIRKYTGRVSDRVLDHGRTKGRDRNA